MGSSGNYLNAIGLSRFQLQPRHVVTLGRCIRAGSLLGANPVRFSAQSEVKEGGIPIEIMLAKHQSIGSGVKQAAKDCRDKVDRVGKEARERRGDRVQQVRAPVQKTRAVVKSCNGTHCNGGSGRIGRIARVVLGAAAEGHILQLVIIAWVRKRRAGPVEGQLGFIQGAIVRIDSTKKSGDLHKLLSLAKDAQTGFQIIRDLNLVRARHSGSLDPKDCDKE